MAKAKEDFYIKNYVVEHGTCFLEDGTCLHEDRNYGMYIYGWIISAALLILGIYLLLFEKSNQIIKSEHRKLATDLKEAKVVKEWDAFLSGFSSDEQKVLKSVKEQDGIKQSTLRYKTGLSKTGLSLILKDFEEREIITRKLVGKTNEVYLRKKF